MSLVGKNYRATEDYEEKLGNVRSIFTHCSIEGDSANWSDRLQFADKETRDKLLTFFGAIAKPDTTQDTLISELSSQGKISDDKYWTNGKSGEGKESTISSLPLNDPELKFAVRFSLCFWFFMNFR
jgi:hypothetical protein